MLSWFMSTIHQRPYAVYSALEQTFERYPERWYEKARLLFFFTAVLAGILIFVLTQFSIPSSPSVWASVVGVSGWFIVWLADVYSTGRIGEMKVAFDQRGLEAFGEERNPLLPPYPTWRDLVVNWTNVVSLILCALLFWMPMLSIVAIVFRGGMVLTNFRTVQRLKLALEWFDQEASGKEDQTAP